MSGVAIVFTIIRIALNLFVLVMWARFILDLAATYARQWRPRGFLLVVAELVFSITDPPIKFVRRFVPPIRAGGIAIDLSWGIVLISAIILGIIAEGFAR